MPRRTKSDPLDRANLRLRVGEIFSHAARPMLAPTRAGDSGTVEIDRTLFVLLDAMRILLTNDDGIGAPGLDAAWRALKEIGEVFVCVPDRPRSACSHQITMHKPLRAKTVETDEGLAYTCNGTPADCVPLALLQLMSAPPDLVISGINLGPNLGDDVHYSGTVAGAMEGVLNGYAALAISLASNSETGGEVPDFDKAANFLRNFVPKMSQLELARDTFLNVNVPAGEVRGVRVSTQGSRRYKGDITRHEAPIAGTYYWRGGIVIDRSERDDSDILAVKDGFISVTPLHVDLTNFDSMNSINDVLQTL
ncbi:MAG TPA: 5'/3'-nucleotidase SurE [Abditibacteriaceae bacterium]|jgi:5'-nucleotidase